MIHTIDRQRRVRRFNKAIGQGNFLGNNRLLLSHANRTLERCERHLHSLWLDRESEDVSRLAHAVGAYAFTTRKENHLGTHDLARLRRRSFEQIEYRELTERLEHDGRRHDGVVLEMTLEKKLLTRNLVFPVCR